MAKQDNRRLIGSRIFLGCVLSILALLAFGGSSAASGPGNHSASPLLSALTQDIDLCALFPTGKDFRLEPGVGKEGSTNACQLYDERSGDAHKFYVMSITNYHSIDSAHGTVSAYARDPNWKPYSGL